ncbi:fibroin light chain-like isoform X2 [Maniola jurtina]|nr:fibroin light chain-like isoform X2 [Maniola jurtina]
MINRNITTSVLEFLDGGDIPLYGHMMIDACHDLAMLGDASSQATSAIQIISIVGAMARGVPGDSCEAAALINTAASGRVGLRAALASYIQRYLNRSIDDIVGLVMTPNAVRYSAGARGNCLGGGRNYQFEEAWDRILNQCNVYQFPLFNEQYCAAKRLYTAFNVRSNNMAAAVTAATLPEVQQAAQYAFGPLSDFLRIVAGGGNPVPAAQAVKSALMRSLPEIDC